MQNVNWDDIRFFLAVYREGTLSGAAKVLAVNHTTVSRRIAALEEKLQVKLLERRRDGFCLTEHAQAVLTFANNMESEALAFTRKLQGRDIQLGGKLRITLPDALSFYLLDKALVDFSQLYPEIQLEVANSDSPLNLNAQEADLAIRLTDNPPENLIGRRVATVDYAIYASASLIDSTPNIDSPDIKALSWMDQKVRPLWLEKNFTRVKLGAKHDSAMGLVSCLRNGAGIAQIPCFIGERDPLLKRIPTKFVEPGWGLWVLHHIDLKKSSKVRIAYQFFSEFLIKEMKNYALTELLRR